MLFSYCLYGRMIEYSVANSSRERIRSRRFFSVIGSQRRTCKFISGEKGRVNESSRGPPLCRPCRLESAAEFPRDRYHRGIPEGNLQECVPNVVMANDPVMSARGRALFRRRHLRVMHNDEPRVFETNLFREFRLGWIQTRLNVRVSPK